MKYHYIISAVFLVAMNGVYAQTSNAQSVPSPTSTPTTVATQSVGQTEIDYSPMTVFMERFSVTERGRPKIIYSVARRSGKPFLNAYATYLTEQNIAGLTQDGQLAYWLNLQNLLVVKAIVEDTKKNNLKKLRGTGGAPGRMWTKPRITIDGTTLSIADIENKLMAGWPETPDLIYGLYQGVKGGPSLNTTGFTAANVHGKLAKAAKQYVNARGIVKVDRQTVSVTPIYDWYKSGLFGASDQVVIRHIRSHAVPGLAYKLLPSHELDMVKLNYRADNYVPKKQVTRQNTNTRYEQPPRSSGGYGS